VNRRRERKKGKLIGVIFGGPSPSILPLVHQFVGEHEGHMFCVDDDLKNTLSLTCIDCEDAADCSKRRSRSNNQLEFNFLNKEEACDGQ